MNKRYYSCGTKICYLKKSVPKQIQSFHFDDFLIKNNRLLKYGCTCICEVK